MSLVSGLCLFIFLLWYFFCFLFPYLIIYVWVSVLAYIVIHSLLVGEFLEQVSCRVRTPFSTSGLTVVDQMSLKSVYVELEH